MKNKIIALVFLVGVTFSNAQEQTIKNSIQSIDDLSYTYGTFNKEAKEEYIYYKNKFSNTNETFDKQAYNDIINKYDFKKLSQEGKLKLTKSSEIFWDEKNDETLTKDKKSKFTGFVHNFFNREKVFEIVNGKTKTIVTYKDDKIKQISLYDKNDVVYEMYKFEINVKFIYHHYMDGEFLKIDSRTYWKDNKLRTKILLVNKQPTKEDKNNFFDSPALNERLAVEYLYLFAYKTGDLMLYGFSNENGYKSVSYDEGNPKLIEQLNKKWDLSGNQFSYYNNGNLHIERKMSGNRKFEHLNAYDENGFVYARMKKDSSYAECYSYKFKDYFGCHMDSLNELGTDPINGQFTIAKLVSDRE